LLRSMSVSNGDPTIFFTRPISLVIMSAAFVSLAYSLQKFYRGKRNQVGVDDDDIGAATVAKDGGARRVRWLTADRTTALLTIPISIGLIFVALVEPRPNIPMAIGPHVWPVCILVLLIACTVPMLLRRGGTPVVSPSSTTAATTASNWYARPGMAAVFTVAGLMVYTLLLEPLGFLLCTTLLVIYQTRVIQQGHWYRNIATAVIFSLLLYFGMTELLSVKLPPGVLHW
jgi:putative tricarboxylic transport membrane protein